LFQLQNAIQAPIERSNPSNFRMIFNVNKLVEMAMSAQSAGRESRASEAAAQALEAEEVAETALADAGGRNASSESSEGRGGRNGRRPRVDGGQIFRDTMAEGDDRVEVDFRLTESGGRTRIRLEEGFVKIFGRLISARFGSSQ